MKSFLALTIVFALIGLISCGPAQQDSEQTEQLPVLLPTQEQAVPDSTEPAQPSRGEVAVPSSTEINQAEIMLNPPHGQPYHRCDIRVGAPLNSAPADTPQTTNNQTETTISQPSASASDITNNPTAPTIENAMRIGPSQSQSTAAVNSGSKPRLNPAHGQPFHRCDIAVGSQLP